MSVLAWVAVIGLALIAVGWPLQLLYLARRYRQRYGRSFWDFRDDEEETEQ